MVFTIQQVLHKYVITYFDN